MTEEEVLKNLNNAACNPWLGDIKTYLNANTFLSTKVDVLKTAVNYAIYNKNEDVLKLLLSRGLFSNSALSEFINKCICFNQLNMVEHLTKMGANLCKRSERYNPLSYAAYQGHIKIIEFLLNNGAQFTIHSALLKAVEGNKLDVIELLFQKGALPNFQNKEGLTPLIQALNKYSVELDVVEKLIKYGADVNLSTPKGTPLIMAIETEKPEIVDIIVKNQADVNLSTPKGTPLIMAIKTEKPEIVDIIVKNQADVNLSTPNGTPLIIAIMTGIPEIVDILVRNQADVNRSTSKGTPLTIAISTGIPAIVEMIVRNQADVNQCDENGNYPITLAMEKRNNEIVKILIENNAKLDVVDKNGDTLFMKAVRLANREMIKYFLEHGEDVNQKNKAGECALLVALSEDDISIFDLLIQSGANPDLASELIQAKAGENPDFAVYVLEMNKKKSDKGLSGQEDSK